MNSVIGRTRARILRGRTILASVILFALAAALVPARADAAAVALTQSSANAIPGAEFTIDVSVQNAAAVNTYSFESVFDSDAIEFVSAQTVGTLSANWNIFTGDTEPGRVFILGVKGSIGSPVSGAGLLIRLRYRFTASAAGVYLLRLEQPSGGLLGATAGTGLVSAPIAQQTLQLHSEAADSGAFVTLPITVAAATDLDAFGMRLNYDGSKLDFISLSTVGSALTGWNSVSGSDAVSGQTIIGGFAGSGTHVTGVGLLMNVTFKITLGLNETIPVTITNLVDDLGGSVVDDGSVQAITQVLSVKAPTVLGAPGLIVTMPIQVAGGQGIDVFGLTLNYDATRMTFLGVENANTLIANWTFFAANELDPGEVAVGGLRGSGTAVNGSGVLFLARFEIGATSTGDIPVSITELRDDLSTASTVNGMVVLGSQSAARPGWSRYSER